MFTKTACRFFGYAFLATVVAFIAMSYHLASGPVSTEDDIVKLGATPVKLSDGRLVEVFTSGVDDGTPILLFHGFSMCGSFFTSKVYDDIWVKHKLRVIAPSLPGHGHSHVHPGRKLTDYVSDAQAILDHFGVDGEFWVAGVSFGAQHAAVIAAHMPSRVLGLGMFAPVLSPDIILPTDEVTPAAAVVNTLLTAPVLKHVFGYLFTRMSYEDMVKSHPTFGAFNQTCTPEFCAVGQTEFTCGFRFSHVGYTQNFAMLAEPWGFDWPTLLHPVRRIAVAYGKRDGILPAARSQYLVEHLQRVDKVLVLDEDHLFFVHLEPLINALLLP